MTKKKIFLGLIIALLAVAFVVPTISTAVSKHLVSLYYVDSNTNKKIHTTYIKDFPEGNTLNLADYEYDLKETFGIYGYSYSGTAQINGETLTKKKIKIESNTDVYLYYNPDTSYQYVVRYFVAKKYGNKIISMENVKTDAVKNWGSASEISITPSVTDAGTYKGYIVTQNGLGHITTSSINKVNSDRKATVKKDDSFKFVCIDFIYEKTLDSDQDVLKKTASWTDEDKKDVEIEITVKPKKNPPVYDSDILVAFDRSGTSDGWVRMDSQAILGGNELGTGTVAQELKSIDLGGNTISYIAFSSRLFGFSKKGLTFTSNHNNYAPGLGYAKGPSAAKQYASTGNSNLTGEISVLYKSMKDNYLSEIKSWMRNSLSDQITGAIKFQKNGSADWGSVTTNYNNTNFDLPLMFAQIYFSELYGEGKSDTSNGRKGYIIFITDAHPYPHGGDTKYTKGRYADKNDYYSILYDGDAAGNKYYDKLSKTLRDTYGIDIYLLVIPKRGSTSAEFIQSVTGKSGYDSSNNRNPNVEVVKNGLDGQQLAAAVKTAVESIMNKMGHDDDGEYIIEDYINSDILNTAKGKITVTCYVDGKEDKDLLKKVKIEGNKIIWNLSDYINKLASNAKIPTFKLKIQASIKEEFYGATMIFNTNTISSEFDNQCKYTYPTGSNTVPTPWLDRKEEAGTLKVYWLITDDSGKVIKTIDSTSESVDFGKGTYSKDRTNEIISTYTYLGHEVKNGTSKPTSRPSKLNSSGTAKYEITKDNKSQTIAYYFAYKKGSVGYRHVVKTSTGAIKTIPNDGNNIYQLSNKDNPVTLNVDKKGEQVKTPYEVERKLYSNNYNYLGFYVEKGKISTSLWGEPASTEDKAKLELTPESCDYIVTFLFEMNNPYNATFEVVHYDEVSNYEVYIGTPGLTDSRLGASLIDFIDWIDLTTEDIKKCNEIADSKDSVSVKLEKLFDLLKNKKIKTGKEFYLKSLAPVREQELGLLYKSLDIKVGNTTYEAGDGGFKKVKEEKATDGRTIATLKNIVGSIKDNNMSFSDDENIITLKFNYIESRRVNVKYVDIDTGDEILDESVIVKSFGESVNVFPLDKPGYSYANVVDVSGGTYTTNSDKTKVSMTLNQNYEVVFKYRGPKTITVKYVDKQDPTHELAVRTIKRCDYYGEQKTVSPINISGWLYINEYEISKPTLLVSATNENTLIKVNMIENVTVTFKYMEARKITTSHVDVLTGEKIIPDEVQIVKYNTIVDTKAYTDRRGAFEEYTYLSRYDIDDSSAVVSENADKSIVKIKAIENNRIIYYYDKIPEVTVVIETPPTPTPGDPTEPGNPYVPGEPSDPTHGVSDKLIVLDETFEIVLKVKNYDRMTRDSNVIIKMPFDVYYFEEGKEVGTNGKFAKANEEMIIETIETDPHDDPDEHDKTFEYYFRLPSWVVEKPLASNPYQASGWIEDKDGEEISREDIKVGVIGKLYDMTVTNLITGDDDRWEKSLFANGNIYREYKADTLPIGQRQVNPNISSFIYKNVNNNTQPTATNTGILLGSKFIFNLNTKGLKSDAIRIIPKLVYFDENGNQLPVTFKYTDVSSNVKDFTNANGIVIDNNTSFDLALSTVTKLSNEIIEENAEATIISKLHPTFNVTSSSVTSIRNLANQYLTYSPVASNVFGSHSKLLIKKNLKVPYINYAKTDLKKTEVNKIGYKYNSINNKMEGPVLQYVDNGAYDNTTNNNSYITKISSLGVTEDMLVNSLNHWYAYYYLPRTLEVRSGNTTLKGGHIVVAFKIVTQDADGYTYLTYHDNSKATAGQWGDENAAISSAGIMTIRLPGQNNVNAQFNVKDGFYPVIVYSTDRIDKDVAITH